MKSKHYFVLSSFSALLLARVISVLAFSYICLSAVQVEGAHYGGGSYDGYDLDMNKSGVGYPWVHNAEGATNVTAESAWLNGMLSYSGSAPARVYVYWGKIDGGTNVDSWSNNHDFGVVSERVLLTFNIEVDGGSTYYYRFQATNSESEVGWAPNSAVFTAPSGPVASTGSGAYSSITTARLYGELIGGIEAEMWVDWGQAEEGFAPSSTNVIDMGTRTEEGSGAAPNPFRVPIGGLSGGTTYAYRVGASNAVGTNITEWVWFTTRCSDFIKAWGLGGPMGGYYDGYNYLGKDGPISSDMRGLLIKFY